MPTTVDFPTLEAEVFTHPHLADARQGEGLAIDAKLVVGHVEGIPALVFLLEPRSSGFFVEEAGEGLAEVGKGLGIGIAGRLVDLREPLRRCKKG